MNIYKKYYNILSVQEIGYMLIIYCKKKNNLLRSRKFARKLVQMYAKERQMESRLNAEIYIWIKRFARANEYCKSLLRNSRRAIPASKPLFIPYHSAAYHLGDIDFYG